MANQPSDDEVFDFSNTEFIREDLINALNEMVHEYQNLSQTFEEVKAENNGLKNSSVPPSIALLGETDSLQTELSKLKFDNDSLRLRSCELKSENERLNLVMSSWTQSSFSLNKLHETQKPINDKSGLGFNAGESSSGETSTQSNLVYEKFKKMNFVKASVIHNTYESVKYDDQTSGKLNQKGKAGIGYIRPENSKPSWLNNRLDKEKARAGSKSSVPHQPRWSSTKVKSVWRKVQPRIDLNGPHPKPKLNRSHNISAHTLMDFCTGKTVKIDSDLVIYRTTLVRTFQVVTICRVDKSEVLVVLISPHYSKLLYEKELEQFFDTALVKDNEILCVIHGKVVAITERFAGVFELPTEGLIDFSEVPNNFVFDARSLFSRSREPVKPSCKKREMKYEFRLLNDILANSVTVKANSFDAVSHELFVLMTAIHFELKVNWRKMLFDTRKEMTDKSSKRAKCYAAQICVLLKGDPAVTLEEEKTFPPLKILSAKTVGTYVSTNKTIDARGESYEPDVAKIAFVKRKSVSKKRSSSISNKETDESPNPSTYSDSRMIFTTADIPLNDETVVDQLVLLATALPTPDLAEYLAQLRTSVTQLSIKQMWTTSIIGDLKNELLSKIDNIEKAAAEARTQQDHVFRDLIKSVKQEVQLQKTALSLEMIEFKKGVRDHSAIVTTDLSDIQKEVKDQKADFSKEFDDRLANIRNDFLEFRVET
ncbi:hypothetical protein F511_02030 [Dorcoceras hygrometricum]|uniref:Uncharacterized protein n=1 Tax=Dorcoceras hygrometricum TaxID=472368 RepID=A0A2Z7AP14_9LAMI|nr:hypothetical protein F511_02030 [Dorcoceras hygrometricum]